MFSRYYANEFSLLPPHTVLIEYRKHHVYEMVGQLYFSDRLRHVPQRLLVDGGTGDVIEGQRCVDLVNALQDLGKIIILFEGNALKVKLLSKFYRNT